MMRSSIPRAAARGVVLLGLLGGFAGCHKDAAQQGGGGMLQHADTEAGLELQHAGDANRVSDTSSAFAGASQTVRRQPSDAKEVDDPTAKRKKAANFVAAILRGEQLTVLEQRGDWMQVRLSDGKSGWVKATTWWMRRGRFWPPT